MPPPPTEEGLWDALASSAARARSIPERGVARGFVHEFMSFFNLSIIDLFVEPQAPTMHGAMHVACFERTIFQDPEFSKSEEKQWSRWGMSHVDVSIFMHISLYIIDRIHIPYSPLTILSTSKAVTGIAIRLVSGQGGIGPSSSAVKASAAQTHNRLRFEKGVLPRNKKTRLRPCQNAACQQRRSRSRKEMQGVGSRRGPAEKDLGRSPGLPRRRPQVGTLPPSRKKVFKSMFWRVGCDP